MVKKLEANNEYGGKIVKFDWVNPKDLIANPKNWRIHPEEQKKVIRDSIKEFGWLKPLIVNINTGILVDGQCRLEVAIEDCMDKVPVQYNDFTEEESDKALSVLDSSAAMAKVDKDAYEKLILGIGVDSLNIREMQNATLGLGEIIEDDKSDDVKPVDKSIPEMELKPFEHYDYIVLMFKDEQAFMAACEKLDIQRIKVELPRAKNPKIGLGRVIDGTTILSKLK